MKGYFIVQSNTVDENFDIKFSIHPELAKNEVPEEQQHLYVEVEKTNNIIKSLNKTDDEIKEKYFNKLLSLSQVGLVGETAQPGLAIKSLKELKKEIVLIEGQRIKNRYMIDLGLWALVSSFIAIMLSGILTVLHMGEFLFPYINVWIGAMVGTWISFGARRFSIEFEQLSILEDDMMYVYIRLAYIGISSIIFLLFLNSDILSIEIGKSTTTDINNNVELQLILGLLCGLVESKLGINMYNKAKRIIGV